MLFGITRVNALSTCAVAVNKLRQQIHMGLLMPAERLPAERRLAEELGVSRVTLREALRVLQTEGYLIVTRGAYGGASVVDEESVEALSLKEMRRDPTRIHRALEFWAINEDAASRLAAERRTPADLKSLKSALQAWTRAETRPDMRRAESTFHLAIGTASGNTWFATAISDAISTAFVPYGPATDLQRRDGRTEGMERILTAIKERDPQTAVLEVTQLITLQRERIRGLVSTRER
jgi:DNA-binding FadR family transcriptional regulator